MTRKETLLSLADKIARLVPHATRQRFSPTFGGQMPNGVTMWWLADAQVSLGTANSYDPDLLCVLFNNSAEIAASLKALAAMENET